MEFLSMAISNVENDIKEFGLKLTPEEYQTAVESEYLRLIQTPSEFVGGIK